MKTNPVVYIFAYLQFQPIKMSNNFLVAAEVPETVLEIPTQRKKCKDPRTTIVVYGGFKIQREKFCYVVTESHRVETKKGVRVREYHPSYHASLSDAVQELSERLFVKELQNREERGETDFESLIQLILDHNEKIKKRFYIE